MIARWTERGVALGTTILIPLALRLRPLPDVLALCDRVAMRAMRPHTPRALAHRVHRWLARGRGPWTSSCLTRSLVLYAMLRQHGYTPRISVGVAGTAQRFDAHAWVTVGGVPVMDAPDVGCTYAEVLSHGA
jgi:hypothetical protein